MAEFWWTCEAGATAGDETTVTAANAGTDGPTSVSSVAGGTRVFDNAQAAHDSWSCRLAVGATSGTSNLTWGTTRIGSPSEAWFAIYIRFSEMLSNRSLARVRSGTTQILRLHRTADGRLELRDGGNSVAATGTVSMSADTWYRIEIHAVPGASSTCTLRLYEGDSTTLLDEVAALDSFGAVSTVTELTVGNIAAGSNIPDYWVDDVRFSDVGWIGPVSGGESHPTTGTAAATAGATAATATTRTVAGTAAASAATTAVSSTTRTTIGSAGALTAATGPHTTVRATSGTARAAAAGPGAHSTSRLAAATASASAAGLAAVTTVRTTAGTAQALAAATAVTAAESSTVTRPDTGTVARPTTGTVTRPAAGTVTRPSTGTISRPDTGMVLRP